jgi:hypothetical protein
MIRSTRAGTPETAYYPSLSNLFNDVGKTLKPKVRAVITLKNMGAGLPDGGFFTQDQFDRNTDEIQTPLAPARGVLEVKPPALQNRSTTLPPVCRWTNTGTVTSWCSLPTCATGCC